MTKIDPKLIEKIDEMRSVLNAVPCNEQGIRYIVSALIEALDAIGSALHQLNKEDGDDG